MTTDAPGVYIELDERWLATMPVDVPRRLALDSRLSLKARGIAVYILSAGARSASEIAEANGCGRDQILSGLRELERHGYLTRPSVSQRRDVASNAYVISARSAVRS